MQEGHGCHLLDCTHVVMCACESLTFEGGIMADSLLGPCMSCRSLQRAVHTAALNAGSINPYQKSPK